jgi:AcrR family transcriptional regulator
MSERSERIKRRTRLSPEARRAQLIELGVEMLATRTLDELSVEDIAAQAGISRGLLFHYFGSKQEFHVEVARAAAAELIARTAPDTSLAPADALQVSLVAFIDYVEENPDSYKSLVRGAAAGDSEMRAIFNDTRATMAGEVVKVVGELGYELSPQAVLAVHGWIGFAEECTVRWIDERTVTRNELQALLANALVGVVLGASDVDSAALAAILTAGSS